MRITTTWHFLSPQKTSTAFNLVTAMNYESDDATAIQEHP